MGREQEDGSILPSNFTSVTPSQDAGMFSSYKLRVGQIIETLPVDHKRNRSKRYVEYDVLVAEAEVTLVRYRNCRTIDTHGDENNFQEQILRPIATGKRGQKDDQEEYVYKDGATVIIGYVEGNKDAALILTCLQHPAIKLDKLTNDIPRFTPVGSSVSRDERLQKLPTETAGALTDDGMRILGEYQGVRWNINKYGELTIIYQGPKDTKGKLTSTATQPTILKFNKDGEFFVIDNLDQEIKISRKDKKILISSGNNPADYIEISRENQTITHAMTKDEIHKIGRDCNTAIGRDESEAVKRDSTIDIGGNQKTTIGKDNVRLIKNRKLEETGGLWRVKAGGEAHIVSPHVRIGTDAANEAMVRGDELRTWLNNHVHLCPACGATTSVPTDPVDAPGGADGVLSAKHKVE